MISFSVLGKGYPRSTSHHPGQFQGAWLRVFSRMIFTRRTFKVAGTTQTRRADAAHRDALQRACLWNYIIFTQRVNDSISSVASPVAVHNGTDGGPPASSQGNFHPIWRSPRQVLSSLPSEQRSRLLFASTVPRSITTTTTRTRINLFPLPPPNTWFIINNFLLTRLANKTSRLGGISLVLILKKRRIRPYSIRIINVCLMFGGAPPLFFVTDWIFVCSKHTTRRIIPSLGNL